MFRSAIHSLLRADCFSCSLDVLHAGLGISILQFLIKKVDIKKNFCCKFFPVFAHRNPGSGLDPDPDRYQPKMLDPDPNSMNPDPKYLKYLHIKKEEARKRRSLVQL
jgi:hypothetical protein